MNHIEKYYNEVYAGKWLNLDEQLAFDKIANLWVKTSNKMEILDMGWDKKMAGLKNPAICKKSYTKNP